MFERHNAEEAVSNLDGHFHDSSILDVFHSTIIGVGICLDLPMTTSKINFTDTYFPVLKKIYSDSYVSTV